MLTYLKNGILASLGNISNPRTAKEGEERNFRNDVLECMFCGTMTEFHHTALIMQSALKGNHPPFLEEIQRDMKVSLEKARHIVLFGYTLPEDDFIYRSMLLARQERGEGSGLYCSVVGSDSKAPSKWLYGEELERFMFDNRDSQFVQVIIRAKVIFGKNIRGYGGKIPGVFLNEGNCVDEVKIEQLMEFRR